MGEDLKNTRGHEQEASWRERANKYAYTTIFGAGALAAAGVGVKEVIGGSIALADVDFGVSLAFGIASFVTRA